MALSAGTRFGVYEIVALIGEGGMGQVYRARDTKLGREVALKVLPELFAADADRIARFTREAQTLASLNHPNIATVYAIEDVAGVRAIAMELVRGQTLAERIAGVTSARTPQDHDAGTRQTSSLRGIPVPEALEIARQIASALDAAHERSVVHRDLKPANILLSADGVVKVLDFGLAKRVDAAVVDSSGTTLTFGATHEGLILGTAAYMSPEQARGATVDKRTDIWAFGCVLYEMLTGASPFGRDTLTETLVAVLDRQPPLDSLPSDAPPLVRRAVVRCLEKDPARRARDIADVAADLQGADVQLTPVLETRRRQRPLLLAGALAGAAAMAGFGAWEWRARRPVEGPPEFTRIVRLTQGAAREFGPAISPDGKWVAYLSDAGGSVAVWVQFLSGGDPVNLTASSGLDLATTTGISGLEVAPDGTRLAVIAKPHGSTNPFATWEIPAPLPGVPRKLLDDGFLGLRWSPDGQHVTFIRAGPSEGDALWIADGDGTNRREIIRASAGVHMHWPAWGSDGFIYFQRQATYVANIDRAEIYRVRPDGTGLEPVVRTLRRAMFPLSVENGGLVYAADPTSAELGLWWRPQSGAAVRLTTGVGEYAEPRMSADRRSLVATLYDVRQSLVRIAIDPATRDRVQSITDAAGGDLDPAVMPSGARIMFSSSSTGDRHVWSVRPDGSDRRPITSGTSTTDERPVASPDGTQVAFISDRSGALAVWVVSAEGGSPRRISDVSPVGQLTWSRDSRQVVFAASGERAGLWRVTVADGTASPIVTGGAAADPSWNPTRDVLAYLEPARSGPANVKLAFTSPEGTRMFPSVPPAPAISAGFANGVVAWSPDGKTVAIVSQNTNLPAAVWTIAPDDERPSFRKVIELPLGPRIRGISWTADGSALIIGQHDWTSDIVLMDSRAR